MFGSTILNVGIGLVFLFCFMSLVTSSLNELIESMLKHRAKNLYKGIQELFRKDDGTVDTASIEKFYKHPLIASLYPGDYDPAKPHNLPSYIPKDSFALALLGGVLKPGEEFNAANVRAALTAPNGAADNHVKKMALLALDTAENKLDTAQKTLEGWFDGNMERVAGWYKRRTGWWLFALGLAASILLNVDAITIAGRLTTDDKLRDAIVAQAEAFVQKHPDGVKDDRAFKEISEEFKSIGYPIGWHWPKDSWPVPAPQGCELKKVAAGTTQKPADASGQTPAAAATEKPDDAAPALECGDAGEYIALALPGWLITALAIMLGAPFWFDLLQKFVNIRSTIKPEPKKKAP